MTVEGPLGESLQQRGEDVRYLPAWSRRPSAQFGIWNSARRIVDDVAPNLVISTGAGEAVPAFIAAKRLRAATFFVETSARLSAPSLTGRLIRPFATETFVQWPDLARYFDGTTVCRPILFDAVASAPRAAGEGTVVFVGTHSEPFDRLLAIVDTATRRGILPPPVFIQAGAGAASSTYNSVPLHAYIPPYEAEQRVAEARYVICHGGAGTIAAALRCGKRPLVLPRLRRHGEHFDDHQLELTERLAQSQLVAMLDGSPITAEDLARADLPLSSAGHGGSLPSVAEAVMAAARRRRLLD